jgi:transcriptional regulator with AAA-type ATPase domain
MDNKEIFISSDGYHKLNLKCSHCFIPVDFLSLQLAVMLYGVILLSNKEQGMVGFVCPSCLCTTLVKYDINNVNTIYYYLNMVNDYSNGFYIGDDDVHNKHYAYEIENYFYVIEFAKQSFNRNRFKRFNNYFMSNRKLTYNTFPLDFSFDVNTLREYKISRFIVNNSNTDNYLTDDDTSNVVSCLPGTLNNDKKETIFIYPTHHVDTLINLENKEKQKIFPRYYYNNEKRKMFEDFARRIICPNLFYEMNNLRDDKKSHLLGSKEQVYRNYQFINILETIDTDAHSFCHDIVELWDLRSPSNKASLNFASDQPNINKGTFNRYYADSIDSLWSNFANQELGEMLSKAAFNFSLQLLAVMSKNDFTDSTLNNLVSSFLILIKDAVNKPQGTTNAKAKLDSDLNLEVKKVESQFPSISKIVSQDQRINELKIRIPKYVIPNNINKYDILITGETGTGKELVAAALHESSGRQGNFIPVNVSAINESIFESQLFGHKRGSFTGANTDAKGYFESADRGTIFLDEIGELKINLQVVLLRPIEYRQIQPVGGKIKNVDVMIILATNKNLKEQMKLNNFRDDLYYRIEAVEINLPPLRDRKEDIPLLVRHIFNYKWSNDNNINNIIVEDGFYNALGDYEFPGNIRELTNIIIKIINNRIINNNFKPITALDLIDIIQINKVHNSINKKGMNLRNSSVI